MKGIQETFSRYDRAGYFKTEVGIAVYLEACADEAPNDPVFMLKALGTLARARNMSQLAEATGMTRAGLYKTLSVEGNPVSPTPWRWQRRSVIDWFWCPIGSDVLFDTSTPRSLSGFGG